MCRLPYTLICNVQQSASTGCINRHRSKTVFFGLILSLLYDLKVKTRDYEITPHSTRVCRKKL